MLPAALAAQLALSVHTKGVILSSTGDPSKNTTAPGGTLAGSGWQYEGVFGSFLGTAIGPHHFITVKHIGIASNTFVYQGASYSVVTWYDDPDTELRIFQVAETFPTYAPLYSSSKEGGSNVVVIGRGTERGDPVNLSGSLRGWLWGPSDGVERWGQNKINYASGNDLWATFDQIGIANEAQLSSGDSGGAAFIKDTTGWKLAGICYAADGATWSTSTGGEFSAALFDRRGFYETDGTPISGSKPVPSRFVAVRISARMAWIRSIVPAPIVPPKGAAQMVSPSPGATLPSSTVTFRWSAGGTAFKILVGNSVGASDIYNSGQLKVRSMMVNNIPTNGVTIYVRLMSLVKGKWKWVDYTYKAYG